MGFLDVLLGNTSASRIKKLRPYVDTINGYGPAMREMSDEQLRAQTGLFRARLQNGEPLDSLIGEAFASVREAARRTVDMEHFDVQLLGGLVLHQGRIAEMKTGEGKTLVATLPAYLNALTGEGVHVVTVNDYLARRDAQWMGKIYRFLGLSVGCVVAGMELAPKQAAYNSDVTYGTNNEFGFDYLRDNMAIHRDEMVQRALRYAIIDEVDSILIDEARTPLIISGAGEESSELYVQANRFVKSLKRGADLVTQSSADRLMGEEVAEDGDYQCDIKRRTVALTAQGIKKAEERFDVENLGAPENMELNHHIIQALRAQSLFIRDRDYVVQDGEVLIVDEFTGRLMIGRRYSEGLHQALEAKEGVQIERENRTLATITLQNYFRMYQKLAGMTGTAKTEEAEFMDIYNLDVVEIEPNLPLQRDDKPDAVFLTEAAKFDSIVSAIKTIHGRGQPVLVGTISVERSEMLSDRLSRERIPHSVLNAKHHEQEAEIIAQAGKLGQVTIATNMAGRGTDILLGGNPDFLARGDMKADGVEDWLIEEATSHAETNDPDILEARKQYRAYYEKRKAETKAEHDEVLKRSEKGEKGGLYIIGTERHESRRIDNQLRGRAGRQGDEGVTQFYVSFEDELMLRFGGERMSSTISRISASDEMRDIKLEIGMLSRQIESAQKRVEKMNFETRKSVLRYDDVINKQREIIYEQRRRVLMGEDVSQSLRSMLHETLDELVETHCPPIAERSAWDWISLSKDVCVLCRCQPIMLFSPEQMSSFSIDEIKQRVIAYAESAYEQITGDIESVDIVRENERVALLRSVDQNWVEHIDAMDQLRKGIGLRAYAQSDPVYAYTSEGFEMFDEMIKAIRVDAVRLLYSLQVQRALAQHKKIWKVTGTNAGGKAGTFKREGKKVRPNDICPYCNSGLKYKKCCGKNK